MKMKTSTLVTTALLFSTVSLSCEKEPVPAPAAKIPETRSADISETTAIDEPAASGKELLFNPQPEPPARAFEFEAQVRTGGEWTGQFQNSYYKGRFLVETGSSVKRGRTVHLVQAWTFYPEPVHPPEPVIPPTPMRPVTVVLKGIHNTVAGILVLNGKQAHVNAKFTSGGSGAVSIGGELMFNPQPEPPAVR